MSKYDKIAKFLAKQPDKTHCIVQIWYHRIRSVKMQKIKKFRDLKAVFHDEIIYSSPDLEKNLFVSQAPFLRVEMCHQNSVIREKNLTKKQRDSRHNLVPKHKNHAQKSNLVH